MQLYLFVIPDDQEGESIRAKKTKEKGEGKCDIMII